MEQTKGREGVSPKGRERKRKQHGGSVPPPRSEMEFKGTNTINSG